MLAAAPCRALLDPAQRPGAPLWNVDTTLVLLLQGLVFWRVGLYRGLWRFASVSDLLNIFKASFIGMVAIVLVLMWKRFDGVPCRCW
jgi:FlaA1/EpsC-like NDP-sugar epimerase